MKLAINYLKVRIQELKHDKRITIKNQKNLIKLYTDSINSMTKAVEHLKQAGQKCKYSKNYCHGGYNAGCNKWIDKLYKFCPYCGREIEEVNVD